MNNSTNLRLPYQSLESNTLTSTESKYHNLISFLKRISISILIIFMITLVEIYWSMGVLSDQISSSCMTCGFLEEALMMAFFTGIFLSVVFALLYKAKKFFIKAIIEFLLLITLWFFLNYSIFVDRESSWSTYDFRSEIYYTTTLSLFPVILLGSACILLLNYRQVFQKNKI